MAIQPILDIDDDLILEESFEFECPFCNRRCSAGLTTVNNLDYEVVTHRVPPCSTYNRLSPHDFVTACYRKMKERNPN